METLALEALPCVSRPHVKVKRGQWLWYTASLMAPWRSPVVFCTPVDSEVFATQSKSADDIIKWAKFPSALAPTLDDTGTIAKDPAERWPWPAPPAAAIGMLLTL